MRAAHSKKHDPETVLVLGGRSEIGLAVAERLIAVGAQKIILGARRCNDLDNEEQALRNADARDVVRVEFDADDVASHREILGHMFTEHGPIDAVILAFGVLGDQQRAETEVAHALEILHTDFVAQVSVLTLTANLMRDQGHGQLVVFSSVAGVRVRRANYVYGSAKAGLDGFASGLGDALHGSDIRLLVVRPGFVIGRMTEGMAPAPFSSTPNQVADATVKAMQRHRSFVWVPGILRPLFAALRFMPQWVWRRLPR